MQSPKLWLQSKYAPPLFFALVSLALAAPLLIKWNYIGVGDWELFVTMAAVPARTIEYYHQFPFWNPYLGGGNILFAHPEVGVLSPFFLLILLFGPIAGIKIKMLLAFFLGLWGTHLFARRLSLSRSSAALAALTYFGSSYFAAHFSIGHVPFTHFCFLPWFLYCVLRAGSDRRFVLAAAAAVALIIVGNGAAVPFLYTAFFSGVFLILSIIFEKTPWRYLKYYLTAIIIGLLLAAVKFIPMLYYLSRNQWEGMPNDVTPLSLLPRIFLSTDQALFQTVGSGQYWGWHEYSAYLSPVVIILAVYALAMRFRRCRLWLILALFFLVFGLGGFSGWSLWSLITALPGFESIRAPSRAFQFVVLPVAMMAGIGLDYLTERLRSAPAVFRLVAPLAIAVVLISNYLVNLPNLELIAYKKPAEKQFHEDFRHVIGDKHEIYDLFLENRGSLMAPWLSAYKESRALVTPDNQVMMEYVLAGRVRSLDGRYTPNRVEYRISPVSDGTIIFGIGYDEGWHAADGRPVFEKNGLVAAGFESHDERIILEYRAPLFWTGLIISFVTLLGCLLILFNGQLRERYEAILK